MDGVTRQLVRALAEILLFQLATSSVETISPLVAIRAFAA
jgi:hypothetical protein